MGAAYLVFLLFGLAVTPRVLGDLRQVPQAELTRSRIGERLGAIQERYRRFATETQDLWFRVEKIRIAYGVSNELEGPPELVQPPGAFPQSIYLEEIRETARLASQARLAIGELEAGVTELQELERGEPERVGSTPSLSPVLGEFVLTSGMGPRASPFTGIEEYHTGADLSAPVGTAVRAPADGRVLFTGRFRIRQRSAWWRFGKMVAVAHGARFITLYGHLDEIRVRRGQRLERGADIGTVGESGVSANPHVHYAVWRRDDLGGYEPVDPRLFMMDRRWSDEEPLLSATEAPESWRYESLPRALR